MSRFKKWLIPLALVCLLLASLIGCSNAPASLGEIFDPSGNPFANRFSDVKDIRTATFVVAASDSVHKYEADYFCDGTADDVQIQAALDKLPDTGGEVFLLDGTYTLDEALVMDNYQTLMGCGRNTIVDCSAGWNILIGATGGSGTEKVGITIADLYITGGNLADDGIRWEYVDYSTINNCWIYDFDEQGMYLIHSDHNVISNNKVDGESGHTTEGIYLYNDSVGNLVIGNDVQGCDDVGIFANSDSHYTTINGNVCYNNSYGIETSSNDCSITGNVCYNNSEDGIMIYYGFYNTLAGNDLADNGTSGIGVESGDYNVIVGNNCRLNDYAGIWLSDAHHNSLTGNFFSENSQWADNSYDNIWLAGSDYNLIEANVCRIGAETNGPRYGINISNATCNNNVVRDNDLYNSGKTGAINDVGTDTALPSITVAFSDGSDTQDSGYLIDADAEYARAWLFLNKEVVEVVRMKVYARSVVDEGQMMRAEFIIYGGADDELYTTHNGSVANHPSTSSSFQANDVIYWTITEAGLLAMLGDDSVEVKVLHEASGDGDIDTQAYFRTVTIEYV